MNKCLFLLQYILITLTFNFPFIISFALGGSPHTLSQYHCKKRMASKVTAKWVCLLALVISNCICLIQGREDSKLSMTTSLELVP